MIERKQPQLFKCPKCNDITPHDKLAERIDGRPGVKYRECLKCGYRTTKNTLHRHPR